MRNPPTANRGRRTFALALVLSTGVLAAESLLPADRQPTALLVRAAIGAYQKIGSPVVAAAGVRCRYSPTCSHYAAEAVERRGTLLGVAQAAGRLLRCAPWGGRGHDPVVARASVLPLQQETPEQRRQREEFQRQMQELERNARQAQQEAKDAMKEAAPAAAFCCIVWVVGVLGALAVQVFMMVFAFKDAKARGDQNAALWIILIFFLHWIGFVVYMIARPKGDLVPCPQCKQKKMQPLVKCPHCGADVAPAKGD